MDEATTTIFALKTHTSTPAQSDANTDSTGATPSILVQFLAAQSIDDFWRNAATQLDQPENEYTHNNGEGLVRHALIDGALQKFLQQSLQKRHLNVSHHHTPFCHPRQRPMYDTLQRDYYWSNMASNLYKTVSTCRSCAKGDTTIKHRCHLQHLHATGPLKFVAMDTVRLLFKTRKGNQHVANITDRYSKLTRAIRSARNTTTVMACILFDACVVPYTIPSYHLTKIVHNFSAMFLASCVRISVQKTWKQLHTTRKLMNRQNAIVKRSYPVYVILSPPINATGASLCHN